MDGKDKVLSSADGSKVKLTAALATAKCLWFCAAYSASASYSVSAFCALATAVAGALLCALNNPFAKGRLNSKLMGKVAVHSLVTAVSIGCLATSIPMLSPSRVFLIFESTTVVMITVLSMVLSRSNRLVPMQAKRGVVLVLVGVLCVWFFDTTTANQFAEIASEGAAAALSTNETEDNILEEAILDEHAAKVLLSPESVSANDFPTGLLLVLLAAGAEVIAQRMTRKTSSDIDSATRLIPMSQIGAAILCAIWYMCSQPIADGHANPSNGWLIRMGVMAGGMTFFTHYLSSMLNSTCARSQWAPSTYIICVFLALCMCMVSGYAQSLGFIALVGYTLMVVGTYVIGLVDRAITGSAELKKSAPQSSSLPLVDPKFGSASLDSLGIGGYVNVVVSVSARYLKIVLGATESRRIFYFLCLNFAFMFIEFGYGFWTNSLGLMSDAFHMLFDNLALAIGLVASVVGRWSSDSTYTYGYGRVEVLSGYINGLFLVFIAVSITKEAVARMFEKPEMTTENLLGVSFAGLLVNLVGMFSLGHAHSHGGGNHGHSHGCGSSKEKKSEDHGNAHDRPTEHAHAHAHGVPENAHGHAHGAPTQTCEANHGHGHGGGDNHAHAHAQEEEEEIVEEDHSDHDANMRGVFLHVLADTLGSVGVIIATLLIDNFGWWIADPICSICIAVLIILSAMPLVRGLTRQLLQRTPKSAENKLNRTLAKVRAIDGVVNTSNFHCWQYTGSKTIATVHIHVDQAAQEQAVLNEASTYFSTAGIHDTTIQIVKESLSHLQARARQQNGFTYSPATPAYG